MRSPRYMAYHDRWVALREELWRAEARIKEIKKELPLIETWLTALDREPPEGEDQEAKEP